VTWFDEPVGVSLRGHPIVAGERGAHGGTPLQIRAPPKLAVEFHNVALFFMSYQEPTNQLQNPRAFQLQPHLVGELIEVRPLTPEDWEPLFAVASDPLIWEQHPASDRYQEEVFKEFFREALESGGALVMIDRATQAIIGSSRYFGLDSEKSEIEIGWTFLARSHWGGQYNGELKRLMLDHAFRFVERVVFLIGPANVRSQKAVEKIGGVMIKRRQKIIRGEAVEQVVYQITKPKTANLESS
jgi:RimJ/RimL family protein N-acetyltransferase